MSVQYFAHDFALGVLDSDAVCEHFCEDCSACSRSEGCPVDGDYFDRDCPMHKEVMCLVEEIEGVLNSYGIY